MEDKSKDTTKGTPSKKRGTTGSELVVGQAAQLIKRSVDSLRSAVETVEKLGESAENYQALIVQKEERIKEIDTEFAEKKRQASVTLDLDIRANEQGAVNTILEKHNQVAVDATQLAELKAAGVKNEKEISDDKAKAIAIATSAMSKDHKNEIALKDADFKATQAESVAKISSLNSQVEFLTKEVNSWKDALAAERIAGVDRSKANAIGSVNVGGPAKN